MRAEASAVNAILAESIVTYQTQSHRYNFVTGPIRDPRKPACFRWHSGCLILCGEIS